MSHELRLAARQAKGAALGRSYVAEKTAEAEQELRLVKALGGPASMAPAEAAFATAVASAEATAAKWGKRRSSRNPLKRMAAAIRLS